MLVFMSLTSRHLSAFGFTRSRPLVHFPRWSAPWFAEPGIFGAAGGPPPGGSGAPLFAVITSVLVGVGSATASSGMFPALIAVSPGAAVAFRVAAADLGRVLASANTTPVAT